MLAAGQRKIVCDISILLQGVKCGRGYGGRDATGFRSMCGPKFYSMSYSSRVDEYNDEVHGLEKKDYSGLVEKLVTIK